MKLFEYIMSSYSLPLKLRFSPSEFFIKNYYIFVMSFYFLSMIFSLIRPGVSSAIVMCIIIIANYRLFTFRKDFFNFILFLYIVYNIFSIFLYIGSTLPVTVFIKEFSNSILPIVFFFIGKNYIDERKLNSFYKIFSLAGVFCLVVGVYLYLFPNEMFIKYLGKTINGFAYKNYLEDKRLNSFLGSTDVGSLSSMLIVLALNYIIRDRLRFKYLVLYAFSILCVGLSMQRSAIVISFFMITIWHFYGIKIKRINYNFLLAEILILVLGFLYILKENPELFSHFLNRIKLVGSAISERSETWFNAIKHSPNIMLGSGLGSAGHKAIGLSKYTVADGSYFKILAETGIIGTFFFLIVFIHTFIKYFSEKRHYQLEISIISILLFQAIGSNVLAFQALLPIFWFSVGRIWSCKNSESINYNF